MSSASSPFQTLKTCIGIATAGVAANEISKKLQTHSTMKSTLTSIITGVSCSFICDKFINDGTSYTLALSTGVGASIGCVYAYSADIKYEYKNPVDCFNSVLAGSAAGGMVALANDSNVVGGVIVGGVIGIVNFLIF